MELKIDEPNGWSKLLHIDKAVIRVGSNPASDVYLPSVRVAPLHLQVLNSPDLPTGCRVMNLGTVLDIERNGSPIPLPTYAKLDLRDGDKVELGEFRLSFSLPAAAGLLRSSRSIEASLSFSDAALRPETALVGILLIKNAGNVPACQFEVALSGLPSDCYQIDPVPLMYPGAQEEVSVRLYHHTLYPPAGTQELVLTITAPEDYPGEELVITQNVFVMPIFKQELKLVDDLAALETPQPATIAPVPVPAVEDAPIAQPEPVAPPVIASPAEPEPVAVKMPPVPVFVKATPAEPVAEMETPAVAPAPVPADVMPAPAPSQPRSRRSRSNLEQPAPAPAPATKPAPVPVPEPTPAPVQKIASVPAPAPTPVPAPAPAPEPVVPVKAPPPPENRPKPKVVRSQPDDFWD